MPDRLRITSQIEGNSAPSRQSSRCDSASSLRYAVKAARFDYAARVKAKLSSVECLYLDQLMKTHDAVEGLQAFVTKRAVQWQHR